MQIADAKSLHLPSSYSIDKNELIKWLEICESTRIKLQKTQVVNLSLGFLVIYNTKNSIIFLI